MSWKDEIARRPLLAALAGVAGLAAIGGGSYEAARLVARGREDGAYGDLVSKLPDADDAATVGRAVIGDLPKFNPSATARMLRKELAKRKLADVTAGDLADGKLAEAGGWVLPESLALLCALAAKSG